MLSAAIIVLLLVVFVPIAVMLSGAVAAAILGFFLKDGVDADHAGSELLDLNT